MAAVKVEVEKPYMLQIFEVTEEMFWEMTDEDIKCDLIDGVLFVHSPASRRHEDIFGFLYTLMRFYADMHQLGAVFGSRMTMDLGARKFEPDIIFIKEENRGRLSEKALSGPADLIIEIVSESTRDFDLKVKREAYREAGISEVWFIDPEEGAVYIDRKRDGEYEEAKFEEGWVESTVIFGFKVKVEWLLSERPPSVAHCLSEIIRLIAGFSTRTPSHPGTTC